MKVAEHHTLLGKPIEIRCFDLAAEAAQIGPTHIICDNQEKIGSIICGMDEVSSQCDKTSHKYVKSHLPLLILGNVSNLLFKGFELFNNVYNGWELLYKSSADL
jgi:hypothetical protein